MSMVIVTQMIVILKKIVIDHVYEIANVIVIVFVNVTIAIVIVGEINQGIEQKQAR